MDKSEYIGMNDPIIQKKRMKCMPRSWNKIAIPGLLFNS